MRRFFLIMLALIMLLPSAAFGVSNGWGPDIGAPDMWNAENREYWSAKIEVVPFVRQNTGVGEFKYVADECAGAIVHERVYYAIKLTVSDHVYDAWWDAAHIKVSHENVSGADISKTSLKNFPLGSGSETMSYDNIKGGGVYWLSHGGTSVQEMEATNNYFEKAADNFDFGAKNIYSATVNSPNPKICAKLDSKWEITADTWNSMHPLRIKKYTLYFEENSNIKTITVQKNNDTVALILGANNMLTQANITIAGNEIKEYTAIPSSVNPCSEDVLLTEVFATLGINFGDTLNEESITNNFGFHDAVAHCFSYNAQDLTPTPELNPAYCTTENPYMILDNGDALEKADFKLYTFNEDGGFYEQTDDYTVSLEKYVNTDNNTANYRLKFEGSTAFDSVGYFAVTAKNTNALESAFAKFTVNGEGSPDVDGAVTEQGTIGGSLDGTSSGDNKPEDIIAFGPVNNTDPGTIPNIEIEEIPEDEYTNKGKEGDNRHKPYDEMQNHANKNEQFIGAYQIDINGGLVKEGKHMRVRFKFDEEFSGKWVLILHYCKKHDRVEEWKIKIDDEGYAVIDDVDSFSPFAVYSTTEPDNQGTGDSPPSNTMTAEVVDYGVERAHMFQWIPLTGGEGDDKTRAYHAWANEYHDDFEDYAKYAIKLTVPEGASEAWYNEAIINDIKVDRVNLSKLGIDNQNIFNFVNYDTVSTTEYFSFPSWDTVKAGGEWYLLKTATGSSKITAATNDSYWVSEFDEDTCVWREEIYKFEANVTAAVKSNSFGGDNEFESSCAFAIKDIYSISGKVVDESDNPIPLVNITITQGKNITGRTTTADTSYPTAGIYLFENLPAGIYNVSASKDGVTRTVLVEITDSDVNIPDIVLPNEKTNSFVEVEDAPDGIGGTGGGSSGEEDGESLEVVVGGVDDLFDDNDQVFTEADGDVVNNDGSVDLKIKVKKKNIKDKDDDDLQLDEDKDKNHHIGLYLEMNVSKEVKDANGNKKYELSKEEIPDVGKLLQIVVKLPKGLREKSEYVVYRVHEGKTESMNALTGDPMTYTGEEEGFFHIKDKDIVIIYARMFSTYGIGYEEDATPVPETPSNSTSGHNHVGAPGILTPVQDQVITGGVNALLSVSAVNASSYQWQVNYGHGWQNILGATGSRYEVHNESAGTQFRCMVSNGCGTAYSPVFTIVKTMGLPKTGDMPTMLAYGLLAAATLLTAGKRREHK